MSFSFDLFLLVILVFISGFTSASETALTTISRVNIKKLVDQNRPGARALQALRDRPSRMLSTILITNNLVGTWAAVLAGSLLIRIFENNGWANLSLAVGLATGVMTFFLLVFGEITPKTVAIRNAQTIALVVAVPILILEWILLPVAAVLTFICRPLVFLLGGGGAEKGPILTEEEIKMILSVGEKEGIIEKSEGKMISSIFEFGDTAVKEVMTPRPDIQSIEINAGVEKAIALVKQEGHSRIPVYEGNLDNILGLVLAKDMLGKTKGKSLRDYLRPVIFIPESKKVDDLLHQMQSARMHLAMVVDEYGSTKGIVTLEDLLEEIVGEIHDEFEQGEKDFEKINENIALVKGSMAIPDVNELLNLSIPENQNEYDTIGGFVLGRLGKVPAVGAVVRYAGLEISVERVLRRRVTLVKIEKKAADLEERRFVGG